MARPKKSVSESNKDKVVAAYLKDPTKSEPEIAKETWVAKSTVHDIKAKSGEIGRATQIVRICDADIKIIDKANSIANRYLNDILEKDILERPDVEQARRSAETSTKRYVIFKWDVTDEEWGLKSPILELWTDELLEKLKQLNNKKEEENTSKKE